MRSSSVARPASSTIALVEDLLGADMRHKETDEYKNAVIISKRCMDDQERASQKIWWAKVNLERGRILAEQRDDGNFAYYDLRSQLRGPRTFGGI